ncbi:hypothetical protein D3C85_1336160 [compost metagenome]
MLRCIAAIQVGNRRNPNRSLSILLTDTSISRAPTIRTQALVGYDARCSQSSESRHMLKNTGGELAREVRQLTWSIRIVGQWLPRHAPQRNVDMYAIRPRIQRKNGREGHRAPMATANFANDLAHVHCAIGSLQCFGRAAGHLILPSCIFRDTHLGIYFSFNQRLGDGIAELLLRPRCLQRETRSRRGDIG